MIKPEPEDTLILLGDYIDRGPDSCGVIELILELNHQCTVIPLAGNHEQMLLRGREERELLLDWLRYGGASTLESYERRKHGRGLEAIPEAHWKFMAEQTLDYWETEKHIFVHATVDPALDMERQPDSALFWQRFARPTVHKSGKQIICGHTRQESGLPAIFDHGICIDTWAYGNGWLTCYDTQRRIFLQCNEDGGRRKFELGTLRNCDDEG